MQQYSNFTVYNASAGSGKTFTLVKEYLKILLISEGVFTFQKILAITFTNKAAGEMKERVLKNLEAFSKGETTDLLLTIEAETNLDKTEIQKKSKQLLEAILQNYTAFSITTIDSFTHKIIRSFAYDLDLNLNFEVEMDALSLLNDAVSVLISKIGTDLKLTEILINYSLEKTNDDKSWDITKDLNEFSKILLNENDSSKIKLLSDKSIDDFINLRKKLFSHQKEIQIKLKNIGSDFLSLLNKNNLSEKDFHRGSIPKFFNTIFLKGVDFDFFKRGLTIEKAFENNQYYKKTTPNDIAASIENIIPQIKDFYKEGKELYKFFLFNKLTLQSLIPLAVLNNVSKELEQLKNDNNIRLNAEFNQLISKKIKDQPTPFIYERLGQRFMHYFIDEMQDTSSLQWQNLIPLIDNALAQEKSSLLLVGDGKQAIYRWRGGKAEQFIDLGDTEYNQDLFQIEKQVKHLNVNYRSYSEIVTFTNTFFTESAFFLSNRSYKNLFITGNKQQENKKKGGFVSIDFLEIIDDKELNKTKYANAVLEKIKILKKQFQLNEICVLTRTKKEGIIIADFLTENGVKIISSETLLLANNEKINFIINFLKLIQNPNDDDVKFNILVFLFKHLQIQKDLHEFLQELILKNNDDLFRTLEVYSIVFKEKEFQHLPLYDKIEYIIYNFKLAQSTDAYIHFFLDLTLERQIKNNSILEFIEYWEIHKEKLSITSNKGDNAVQIMTIHKSKGLEFPVVIFPSDVDIYRERTPKVWLNNLPKNFTGFKNFLVNKVKNLEILTDESATIYNTQKEQLELDNLNLLYVALTRPIEHLYIITDKKTDKKDKFKEGFYSSLFYNFLKNKQLWNIKKTNYSFGNNSRIKGKTNNRDENEILKSRPYNKFITTFNKNKKTIVLANASALWNTNQEKAINYGTLVHEILSKINTKEETLFVLDNYEICGKISKKEKIKLASKILEVTNHPMLKEFFSKTFKNYNEREQLYNKTTFIPDRLLINSQNEAFILDYKTGLPQTSHNKQLLSYKKMLTKKDITIKQMFLIYLNDNLLVKEVH